MGAGGDAQGAATAAMPINEWGFVLVNADQSADGAGLLRGTTAAVLATAVIHQKYALATSIQSHFYLHSLVVSSGGQT